MSEPQTGELGALLQQDYIKRLIESDLLFNNVTVLAEDEGNIISQMDKALGFTSLKDGACGTCVIVRQPNGDDGMPGVLWPPLGLEWDILVLEWREMNRDTTKGGTGKRAWTLARRIHRLIKAHRAPGIVQCFTPRHPTIIRTSSTREINGTEIPLMGYTVRIAANEADNTPYTKVALPTLSGSPALDTTSHAIPSAAAGCVLTVTCSTSGAAIYYTTDLSNPWSGNAGATLYSGPITTVAGTYLFRAFDDANGAIGSDAIAAKFT
jgi:hypothetical protein